MGVPTSIKPQFLAISAVLTGFSELELARTDMADAYWGTLVDMAGEMIAGDFMSACATILAASQSPADLPGMIEAQLLKHPAFGPLARNIIVMWYLGQWSALPREWCDAYGSRMDDCNRMISAHAYQESLVWQAFGSHPQGAKPTGWGSWSDPPLNAAEILRQAGF